MLSKDIEVALKRLHQKLEHYMYRYPCSSDICSTSIADPSYACRSSSTCERGVLELIYYTDGESLNGLQNGGESLRWRVVPRLIPSMFPLREEPTSFFRSRDLDTGTWNMLAYDGHFQTTDPNATRLGPTVRRARCLERSQFPL